MTVQIGPISDEERAKRQIAINFARHSVRLEGITLDPALDTINLLFIKGEIDEAEHVRRCLAAIDDGATPQVC